VTTISEVYDGAEKLINEFIRKELRDQGHYLTGELERSLEAQSTQTDKASLLEGYSAHYMEWVNNGFKAKSASFKQFPFLVQYFVARGYPEKTTDGSLSANQLAAMTINKWMKEGMPTASSNRFSQVTRRKLAIENAFQDNKQNLDNYMLGGLDSVVEFEFQKEKSEII
jgi:hypothetical protein